MHLKTRGTLEMTAAMLISGTVGWFVLAADQPAAAVVFWRCLFGALALLLACAGLGLLRRGRISRRQALAAAVGGVALVLNWVLLFSAYGHASIAVSTVVYHTQPFMLVGLGMLLFAEKMTAGKAGWLLAAFAGMLLIVMAGSSADAVAGDYRLGVLMALGAAFFYVIAAVITKRLHGVAPQLIVLIQMLVGVGLLAPFAQVPGLTRAPATWAWLATIGIVHTGLMSTLLYSAIQKIPTSLVGALSFIYPVVAILVDWLALGHPLSALQLAGSGLILLAAAGMTFGWTLRITTATRPIAGKASSHRGR